MTRSARGALTGGAAGLVVVSLMLRGTLTAGFPVVALALWERALRLMPMEVFGFIIVRLKFLAKPAAFWGMLGALIVGAAFLGWLLGRAPWNRRPSRGAGAAAVRSTATFLAGFALTFVPLIALAFSSATEYLRGRLEVGRERNGFLREHHRFADPHHAHLAIGGQGFTLRRPADVQALQ